MKPHLGQQIFIYCTTVIAKIKESGHNSKVYNASSQLVMKRDTNSLSLHQEISMDFKSRRIM